jgi:hypothetical protein
MAATGAESASEPQWIAPTFQFRSPVSNRRGRHDNRELKNSTSETPIFAQIRCLPATIGKSTR